MGIQLRMAALPALATMSVEGNAALDVAYSQGRPFYSGSWRADRGTLVVRSDSSRAFTIEVTRLHFVVDPAGQGGKGEFQLDGTLTGRLR